MLKLRSRSSSGVRPKLRTYLLASALVLTPTAVWGGAAGAAPTAHASRSTSGNCAVTVGLFAPFTGSAADYGKYLKESFELALRSFPKGKLHCKVSTQNFDTKGTTSVTPPLATSAAQNPKIVAVVGPTFSALRGQAWGASPDSCSWTSLPLDP